MAAVLDWEMVTVGSPEKDVGWAVFLDRHHSEGINTPRLAGFPSYEEAIAHYEACSGHRVKHLQYFQVFAGFRFAVIMMRITQQLGHYGMMTAEQSRAMEQNNTVTQLTAKILGLPSPAELMVALRDEPARSSCARAARPVVSCARAAGRAPRGPLSLHGSLGALCC